MAQINFHTTPEVDSALDRLMRRRGLRTKSEAIRLVICEAAGLEENVPAKDFANLVGLFNRLPNKPAPKRTAQQVLDDIDAEMEAKLARLSKR